MAGPDDDPCDAASCCAPAGACVFEKALLARSAQCTLALRRQHGEREVVFCSVPVARINCDTLQRLLRERAAFALKLPHGPGPLVHTKALQLQCGGLAGLRHLLATRDRPAAAAALAGEADVHRLVAAAGQTWGSLMDLPWAELVGAVRAWTPRRRRGPA